jgi:hypothetical protein
MRQKYPVGMNLCITSRCNRRCPDCGASVGFKSPGYDLDWNTIESLGQIIGYLPGGPITGGAYASTNIGYNITGGEPSFHQQFVEFAPKLRSVLKCNRMIITTNGWGFTRFPEAFMVFDEIWTTYYGEHVYPGCPSNTGDIQFMSEYIKRVKNPPQFMSFSPGRHHSRPSAGSGSCFRGHDGYVNFWEGLIYPCCVAHGMEGGVGIVPTADWRDKITQVELPCLKCCFRS